MNNCTTCGRGIRLAAMKVSVNRTRGTAHWLNNTDGDANCPCLEPWVWTKWRADKRAPTITDQKVAEWNAANPTKGEPDDRA